MPPSTPHGGHSAVCCKLLHHSARLCLLVCGTPARNRHSAHTPGSGDSALTHAREACGLRARRYYGRELICLAPGCASHLPCLSRSTGAETTLEQVDPQAHHIMPDVQAEGRLEGELEEGRSSVVPCAMVCSCGWPIMATKCWRLARLKRGLPAGARGEAEVRLSSRAE